MSVRLGFALAVLLMPPPGAAASAAEPEGTDTLRIVLAPRDTLSSGLRRPAGVAVDAFGRITVADEERHTLERFAPDGRWLESTGALGSEPGRFRRPGSLAALGSLGIAVHDRDNRRIVAYDQHLRRIGIVADFTSESFTARFGRVDPVAMTADAGGAVLVADADRDRLLAFDFAGAFVREIGGFGGRSGAFQGLAALTAGARGGFVTLESGSRPKRARAGAPAAAPARARIQWFDAGGSVLGSAWLDWASAESREGAIAVDAAGRIAVANAVTGEVRLLSPEGRTLAIVQALARPSALAFGADGALWVAETAAARVRSFTLAPASAAD